MIVSPSPGILLQWLIQDFENGINYLISSGTSISELPYFLYCIITYFERNPYPDLWGRFLLYALHAMDIHCDIMGSDVVMGPYHDVIMHTEVARTIIY